MDASASSIDDAGVGSDIRAISVGAGQGGAVSGAGRSDALTLTNLISKAPHGASAQHSAVQAAYAEFA